nr:FAD-binding protein [Pseudomonas sp. 1079]
MAFDLVTVSDRRHSTLQKGFNLRWPLGNVQGQSSPNGANLIYLCRSPQDIMDAAAQALALPNGRITVRSGGHCYEGFVANKMPDSPNEVLSILDISALNRVIYDANGQIGSELNPTQPFRYRFRLEAGGQNWDAYGALYKLANKTLPGGSCYSVGLGGHICGGGYGLLSRKYGLVCDWLSGVDILVPDSQGKGLEPRHVSRDSTQQDELDLFAACCGAGGWSIRHYHQLLLQGPATGPQRSTVAGVGMGLVSTDPGCTEQSAGGLPEMVRQSSEQPGHLGPGDQTGNAPRAHRQYHLGYPLCGQGG